MQVNNYHHTTNLAIGNPSHPFSAANNHNNIHTVVNFLKEVIPSSYIFCNTTSVYRTDLIIVMDQYQYRPLDEVVTLLDFAILGQKNINCTVYTYATIYEFLAKGHLYFSSVCTPNNCIYQSKPGFTLPLLDQEKCKMLIENAKELFEQNMQKAITFFRAACKCVSESESTISAFMLQQACELSYRSLLLALRGKQVKCHDLVVLRKHLIHFVPTLIGILNQDENEEIGLLTRIQEAYIKSRYDQSYKISFDELNAAITASEKLIRCVQEIFNDHCQKIIAPQTICKTTS